MSFGNYFCDKWRAFSIFPVEMFDSTHKSLEELFLNILLNKNVIWGYAGLAVVEVLNLSDSIVISVYSTYDMS